MMSARVRRFALSMLLGLCAASIVHAGEYSWRKPHAKVLPTGDLEWAPEPFRFEHGEEVRYIDFENGNDDSDGLSKETPWKHHPWDLSASGEAKGEHGLATYH